MIQLRDLTDESGGTCDWGSCDELTVAERHDAEYGWLAVCYRHSGRHGVRQSPGRAACPTCGKVYALTVDGQMRHHDRGFAQRCPGSGTAVEVAKV